MGGSGSVLFTDAEAFRAHLPGNAHFVMAKGVPFRARLTWMELRRLLLVHARETTRRVAYLSPPADRTSAFFPIDRSSVLICDGTEVGAGEIVLCRDGLSMHHRTLGATRWSTISLKTTMLCDIGAVLTGRSFIHAPGMNLLRPPSMEWRQLLKLHSEAVRIAETRLPHIDHPEVARALEQQLIWALVNCLANAQVIGQAIGIERSNTLTRFEACVAKHAAEPLPISAICECIHVSERALRALCSRVLGMSPARYQRLRALATGPGGRPRRD
jgi:AraC-like DNA-binding protein